MATESGPFGVSNAAESEAPGISNAGESEIPGVSRADGNGAVPKKGLMRSFGKKGLVILLASALGLGALYEMHKPSKPGGFSLTSITQLFNHKASPNGGLGIDFGSSTDNKELRNLKAELGKTKYGQALLAFAQSQKITFATDPKVGDYLSMYDQPGSRIVFKPGLRPEAAVMLAAFEIRCVWQDKILHTSDIEATALTPQQRWTLLRFKQADAQAFAGYVEADRLRQGFAKDNGFYEATHTSEDAPAGEKTAAAVAGKIGTIAINLATAEQANDGGLTFNNYLHYGFEPALTQAVPYYAWLLLNVETQTQNFLSSVKQAGTDPVKLAALEKKVSAAPDDEAFKNLLLKMGGVSLSPQGITALQGIAPARLTEQYPWPQDRESARVDISGTAKKELARIGVIQQRVIGELHDASKKANVPPTASRPAS